MGALHEVGACTWNWRVFSFIWRERRLAREALQSCEAVVQGTFRPEGGDAEISAEGLPCWYYMSAVQDMLVLVDDAMRGRYESVREPRAP
jgi:hypothetical protein